MGVFETSDGFDFETTIEGEAICCVCRRDGEESMVIAYLGKDAENGRILVELLELVARNLWVVNRRAKARAEGRNPPDYDD